MHWIVPGLIIAGAVFFTVKQTPAAKTGGQERMLPLGTQAPDFHLKDVVSGKTISRDDFAGKQALVVIFLCRHCPYVQHVKEGLVQMGRDYAGTGVAIVGISSNDPAAYPDDAPARLKEMAVQDGFPFPILFDETQEVAKAYTAACTPDPFVFDRNRHLVYRGQFDGSRPGGKQPVTGKDLREAIDAVLAGRPVNPDPRSSVGCSIKWKPGNEPVVR